MKKLLSIVAMLVFVAGFTFAQTPEKKASKKEATKKEVTKKEACKKEAKTDTTKKVVKK